MIPCNVWIGRSRDALSIRCTPMTAVSNVRLGDWLLSRRVVLALLLLLASTTGAMGDKLSSPKVTGPAEPPDQSYIQKRLPILPWPGASVKKGRFGGEAEYGVYTEEEHGDFPMERQYRGKTAVEVHAIPMGVGGVSVWDNYRDHLEYIGFNIAYECERHRCTHGTLLFWLDRNDRLGQWPGVDPEHWERTKSYRLLSAHRRDGLGLTLAVVESTGGEATHVVLDLIDAVPIVNEGDAVLHPEAR